MNAFTLVAGTAFVAALLLTPICRDLATRLRLLDYPDTVRKSHALPIPRVGGIAVMLAYLSAIGVVICFSHSRDFVRINLRLAGNLVAAGGIVFLTGLIDDIVGLKPWQKLSGQVIAAVVVCSVGVHFGSGSGFGLGSWWSIPLTVIWVVACTNAFNLIDGMDGLAAGVGLFATVATFAAALLQKDYALALATAPLAGALLGFLRYNFNPATIFLGDCGSLTVGFLLGCYSLLWSTKSATALGMTAPLMVLAIPLFDTVLAITRRYLRQRPIFGADSGHIHHKLLARGLSPRHVAARIYGVCGTGACLSLLQSTFSRSLGGIVILVFCVGAGLGIAHLRYPELHGVQRLLFQSRFRRRLNTQLELDAVREELAAAAAPDDYWSVLNQRYKIFGCTGIELRIGDGYFADWCEESGSAACCEIRIGVSKSGYVNLFAQLDTTTSAAIAEFAEVIGRSLMERPQRADSFSPSNLSRATFENTGRKFRVVTAGSG